MTRFWWGLFAVSLLAVGGLFIWDSARSREERLVPILGRVDNFSLKNQNNQPVTRQDLLGKAWIADFIYTSCPAQCPMMSRRMQVVQGLIPKDAPVQLVSITVDPKRDTPAALAKYAEKYHYEAARWHFLTGRPADIEALTRSFKLPQPAPSTANEIDHSTRLVLVDARSRIRGYYDATNEQEVNKLVRDVSIVTSDTVR